MRVKITAQPPLTARQGSYGFGGREYLSFTTYLGFSLTLRPTLLAPEDYLKVATLALTPLAAQGIFLDNGLPKTRGEFYVQGEAYAPGGEKARSLIVDMEVGRLRRYLLAGESFGAPAREPIASLPLTWKETALSPFNPHGLDLAKIKARGGAVPPAVYPLERSQKGEYTLPLNASQIPASPLPSPLGVDFSFSGTYGEDWLQ
ncbi:MAG: DUF2169 domain-containing protein, partial [Deltaproteobacteria bacterium]|nr:DUF2169 domain-containing protein [Deltaproteobacteria bacterium]